MRRGIVNTLAVCAVLITSSSCGDDSSTPETPDQFTDRDASFVVDVGDEFTITLESNMTTGYGWELSADLPRDVVRLVDDEYIEPDTDLVGVAGSQVFTFEAVGDGSTYVQLWYVRPFDDPPEPADRAQFEVIVGDGGASAPPPGDGDDIAPPVPDDEDAIDLTTLLADEPTGTVVVTTLLFDDGDGLVMCEVLAESYPPQCMGETLAIVNPDDVDADYTMTQGIRWTDRPEVLIGRLVDGGFEVTAS